MIMTDSQKQIIQKILSQYPYDFYAFGSRVKGNPRKMSDLDLCFMDNIPLHVLSNIEEDFEESDLPFSVDILDWQKLNPDFQKKIEKDLTLIHKKT